MTLGTRKEPEMKATSEMKERLYPSRPMAAVGAVVIGRRGVLLVRRDKDPGRGRWSIPGGVVEIGETQEQAVVREVREETGIDVRVIRIIDSFDLITRDNEGRIRFHYVINHYLARTDSEDAEPVPESAEAVAAWFAPEELDNVDAPREVINLIRKALAQTRGPRGP